MRRFLKAHFFFYVFVWTVLKSRLWRAVSKRCGYVNQLPETERRGFVNSPTETTSFKVHFISLYGRYKFIAKLIVDLQLLFIHCSYLVLCRC